MRVLALREHPERGGQGADQVFGPTQLEQLLGQAEYVLLAAPLTPKTKALFNSASFSKMRPDAAFVNVSRGALVDEIALTSALRSGKLRAAALDVFETEPLPPDSQLWDLENLFITPHTAALTDKLWDRHYLRVAENLRRYIENKPLLGEVDKQKGY